MQTALNVLLPPIVLMSIGLFSTMSYLPISRKRPKSAKQRTLALNLSSESELRTKSTPRPSVSFNINSSNEQSRELPIRLSVIEGNVVLINSRLASVPTVVKTLQPIDKQT